MVKILDTTLREGEQTPGVYFDNHIKLAIARLIEKIGVDIIETGHPVVSEEIKKAVAQISNSNLNLLVGAHARSLKKDVDLALECGVNFLGIFFCVSEDRLKGVFNKTLIEAIDQITDIIKYAKQKNSHLLIRFTPEDTVRSEFSNVVKASVAAVKSGADIISIADTTGYMVPGVRSMYDYVKNLKQEFKNYGINPMVAVHCHNDKGLALANALDAYRAGVDIIDASVLGLGERAGIVDLAQLLTVLRTEYNEDSRNLKFLPELYDLVSKHSNVNIVANFPIVGNNAFTHCAGVHTQAALKDPMHYQSLDPKIVGRESIISLDHMSGMASIRYSLDKIDEKVDNRIAQKILARVKEVGHKGKVIDLEEFKHIVKWCKNGNNN
ncbi:2-isopropylmalate synthase [Candidatus Woesearchaeota archaeon]|jgi:2-isopropylmalate synthase|nr:2-isopropylmalate synthase [archaeon]MBT5023476.1 2-isopropylmalate synthase [Candidatus Woesearchaeota archaeon]MBT4022587.1 2-isopropylmalate synthase [archaeon]MBT4272027.1 2-isopropylmalate synthase [archaeon]MBT4461124.1 2-isopropylmalate synthase [archaeon]